MVFLDAVSRGDEQLVEKMLDEGMDPNVATADGLTALHQVGLLECMRVNE